jgi:hypothetical protein
MSSSIPRPVAERRPVALRQRPDPNPLRIAAGVAGLAAATAMVSAMLTPAPLAQTVQVVTAAAPEPAVVHVTRYVTLAPGQTAPPQAVVQQQAAPAPRTVIVTTRQSGTRP